MGTQKTERRTRQRKAAANKGRAAALAALAPRLAETLKAALDHVLELEDAWARGRIKELDSGSLGTRSNRNVTVRVMLERAKSEYDALEEHQE